MNSDYKPPRLSETERIRVLRRQLLSDEWARLEQVKFDYLRSDGTWQTQQREIYHRGHGAAILLYNLNLSTIVLTRQFRFPAWEIDGQGFLLEVPAGIIEGQNAMETACLEAEQETGFVVRNAQFLYQAFATPGSVTEQLSYFAAAYDPENRTGEGGGVHDEGEDIEVLEVPVEKALRWVADGTIRDAKTIILLQYAQINIFNSPG
ncbi:MAG: NUDIX domain-containing protein [Granulosicoccus sp.]|nr:NUDIX domain-containing protein [Granulosicoccus sp.]